MHYTGKPIIIADTPEVFAIETVRLLQDNKLRKDLAANGRKLASSTYNWDNIVETLY